MAIDYSYLPEHMQEGVRGYIERGWLPGSFLNAVLCNNLTTAAANADEINKHALFQWAQFLIQELPMEAYGSQEIVNAYVRKKRSKSDA